MHWPSCSSARQIRLPALARDVRAQRTRGRDAGAATRTRRRASCARAAQSVEVRIAQDLVSRCRAQTIDANELEREVALRVAAYAPQLLDLKGCGALIAGKLIGETGGIGRFRTDAQLARLAGVAPLDASTTTPPPQPPRKPPAQHRAAQTGRGPRPLGPTRSRVSRTPAGRRQDPTRSAALPQATAGTPCLPPPAPDTHEVSRTRGQDPWRKGSSRRSRLSGR